ncbi:hypothetical protein [Glutamicibacter sp. PS]|uniref:COG4315 family predicted lipoprotein n=1 Tax=Glutamicibacter sp. PS TaxID=3075634 RepID=UPI002841A30C|nr:hypothetical protein [Glutamicibacter sp. PS]MDR4534038.1 hypothetical protein [Glutamicibacter sp. PS]
MRTRIMLTTAVLSAGLLALTACGDSSESPGGGGGYGAPKSESPSSSPAAMLGVRALHVVESDLGQIVTDDKGMVLYQFDKDTQGADSSACADECLKAWPPVSAGEELPELQGVTGEVGTITGTDGSRQLTLNGWPLYYFAADAEAGETKGQGVKDVWWVLDPAGEPIRE